MSTTAPTSPLMILPRGLRPPGVERVGCVRAGLPPSPEAVDIGVVQEEERIGGRVCCAQVATDRVVDVAVDRHEIPLKGCERLDAQHRFTRPRVGSRLSSTLSRSTVQASGSAGSVSGAGSDSGAEI
jgi:hypothetical protein